MLKLVSGGEPAYEFALVPKGIFFSFKNAQREQKKAPLEEKASDVMRRF